MKKKLFSLLFVISIIPATLPTLSCENSDKNGVITGGACSISELNSKTEEQNQKKSLVKSQKTNVEDFKTPSQKILCKYSLCPVFFESK